MLSDYLNKRIVLSYLLFTIALRLRSMDMEDIGIYNDDRHLTYIYAIAPYFVLTNG